MHCVHSIYTHQLQYNDLDILSIHDNIICRQGMHFQLNRHAHHMKKKQHVWALVSHTSSAWHCLCVSRLDVNIIMPANIHSIMITCTIIIQVNTGNKAKPPAYRSTNNALIIIMTHQQICIITAVRIAWKSWFAEQTATRWNLCKASSKCRPDQNHAII